MHTPCTVCTVHDDVLSNEHDEMVSNKHNVLLSNEHDVILNNEHDVMLSNEHDDMLSNEYDFMLNNEHDVMLSNEHDVMLNSEHDVMTHRANIHAVEADGLVCVGLVGKVHHLPGHVHPSQAVAHGDSLHHRRRIKTEEKAKVVAVVWGTYLNAALTI